jgi:hypothetical protein
MPTVPTPNQLAAAYDRMLQDTDKPWCWACGRDARDRPDWWGGIWMLHRHHIVRPRRRRDRRAVILLCPVCHGRCHGERYANEPGAAVSLSGQLWLKRQMDPEFYDRAFLRAHKLGRLPPAHEPFREYRRVYSKRRGGRAMV